MMGLRPVTNPEAAQLPPTLRSMWLVFLCCSTAAARRLSALRRLGGGAAVELRDVRRLMNRLPDLPVIEAYTIRFYRLRSFFWTTRSARGHLAINRGAVIGAGPHRTWSLVTWLAYGILLHARLFFRLQARATAWGNGCLLCTVGPDGAHFSVPFFVVAFRLFSMKHHHE